MRRLPEELEDALEELRHEGLSRTLSPPEGADFASNDYLGLSHDPELRRLVLRRLEDGGPLGAPSSRLLRGHLEEHRRLEEKLAHFKGTEAALLFSTGYQANIGVLTSLVRPGDRVLSDELNHASIIDGLRLSGARKVVFPHLDVDRLEAELASRHPGGRTFIVTESLFSMEGDVAPLDRYAELSRSHGASLIVDDAHAMGVYGDERGSGLLEDSGVAGEVDAVVSTFGKAFGLFGAFVGGPRTVVDWLVARARSFIFTTAPPPLLLHAVDAALEIATSQPERRVRVRELAGRLRRGLRAAGVDVPESGGPIVPLLVGDNREACGMAAALRERGFDVRAIRPPSVPPGTARLRMSVHFHNTEAEVDGLCRELAALRAGVEP
ncbi:MAG: 8-amino-7-oxononanoate synthase [Planctomycetota bacterium]|nr:8-amino-7-oxononanoate synthase [Planctomycetota bacterium]